MREGPGGSLLNFRRQLIGKGWVDEDQMLNFGKACEKSNMLGTDPNEIKSAMQLFTNTHALNYCYSKTFSNRSPIQLSFKDQIYSLTTNCLLLIEQRMHLFSTGKVAANRMACTFI